MNNFIETFENYVLLNDIQNKKCKKCNYADKLYVLSKYCSHCKSKTLEINDANLNFAINVLQIFISTSNYATKSRNVDLLFYLEEIKKSIEKNKKKIIPSIVKLFHLFKNVGVIGIPEPPLCFSVDELQIGNIGAFISDKELDLLNTATGNAIMCHELTGASISFLLEYYIKNTNFIQRMLN